MSIKVFELHSGVLKYPPADTQHDEKDQRSPSFDTNVHIMKINKLLAVSSGFV